jgi:hypothetical protein
MLMVGTPFRLIIEAGSPLKTCEDDNIIDYLLIDWACWPCCFDN